MYWSKLPCFELPYLQHVERHRIQYGCNSYSTLEEAVSSLLSRVGVGDPTPSELVDYLLEEVGEDADIP